MSAPCSPTDPTSACPSSDPGPLVVLLRRLGVAALIVHRRDGRLPRPRRLPRRRRRADRLLDAFYFGAVSVTTTGYGDITPVTDGARLVSTLVVTPARVLFLIILVGDDARGARRADTRTSIARRAGGGRWRTTRSSAASASRGAPRSRPCSRTARSPSASSSSTRARSRSRTRAGAASPASSATRASAAVLEAADVHEAAAVIVAPDRDDSAVLITLTARELNRGARIVAAVRERENAHLLRAGRRGLRHRVLRRRRAAARPGRPEPAHRARCSRTCCRSARGST